VELLIQPLKIVILSEVRFPRFAEISESKDLLLLLGGAALRHGDVSL